MRSWGRGGIGRRSGLKIRRLRSCGFESHRPHQIRLAARGRVYEMLEKRIREAVEQADEDVLIAGVIERGRADIAEGRYIVGDAAWDEIEKRFAR